MLCTPTPNGFADHYPYFLYLFMAISLGVYPIFRSIPIYEYLRIIYEWARLDRTAQTLANPIQKSLILGAVSIINKANHKPPPNLNCLKMVV